MDLVMGVRLSRCAFGHTSTYKQTRTHTHRQECHRSVPRNGRKKRHAYAKKYVGCLEIRLALVPRPGLGKDGFRGAYLHT